MASEWELFIEDLTQPSIFNVSTYTMSLLAPSCWRDLEKASTNPDEFTVHQQGNIEDYIFLLVEVWWGKEILFLTKEAYDHCGLQTRKLGQAKKSYSGLKNSSKMRMSDLQLLLNLSWFGNGNKSPFENWKESLWK